MWKPRTGYRAGTVHKVAWRHFRHAVYTRIHVYASGHEKVSSGNLGSGTLADKTPAHWPRLTENWWSDPQSELLDWQNPETGPKLSADPRSTVFFKSANPLDLSPKSTIRELFKAKSADPRTYSPPSLNPLECDILDLRLGYRYAMFPRVVQSVWYTSCELWFFWNC